MRLRHTSHSGALSLCLGNSLHTSSQEEPGLLKAALIEGVAHSSQIVVHLVLSSPSTFFFVTGTTSGSSMTTNVCELPTS